MNNTFSKKLLLIGGAALLAVACQPKAGNNMQNSQDSDKSEMPSSGCGCSSKACMPSDSKDCMKKDDACSVNEAKEQAPTAAVVPQAKEEVRTAVVTSAPSEVSASAPAAAEAISNVPVTP